MEEEDEFLRSMDSDECLNQNASYRTKPLFNEQKLGVFHKGFLGDPEPFAFSSGEFGPPFVQHGEIDWKTYCFSLIIADGLLTLAFFYLLTTMPPGFRIRGISPTLKFTVGIIYGACRCTIILYMLRHKPSAFYQYFAVLTLIIYSYFGLIALLFEEGPWRNLRGSNLGIYKWETELNPMFFLHRKLKARLLSLEYTLLNLFQRITDFDFHYNKNKSKWSFFKLAEIISFGHSEKPDSRRNSEDRVTIHGLGSTLKISTSVQKWNEAMLFCNLDAMKLHFETNFVLQSDLDYLDLKSAREARLKPTGKSRQFQKNQFVFDQESKKIVRSDTLSEVSETELYLQRRASEDRMEFSANTLMNYQQNMYRSKDEFRRSRSKAILDAQSEMSVSSWLADLVQDLEDSEPESGLMFKRLKRCLVKIGTNGLLYEIDVSNPLPDIKAVLHLEHDFERLRKKLKRGGSRSSKLKSSVKTKKEKFSCIEIIGKHDGNKMRYFFAQYKRFGQQFALNDVQQQTVLWLMNTLNDVDEKRLACFRTKDCFKLFS